MALIKCPECGKEISNEAKACPHCGKPIPREKGKLFYKSINFWIVMAAVLLVAIMVIFFIVQYNKGVEKARQSDEYKELQEIIDRSKKISSEAESDLEELKEMQDQLDRLSYD
ncbi:MAG: zinc-ribbon domain-containing protein [Ruminococcus sp.]|nr:zinc-ribbon domain-containing protein [Ruminococcus sp.]